MVEQQGWSCSFIVIIEADDGGKVGNVYIHDYPTKLETHRHVNKWNKFRVKAAVTGPSQTDPIETEEGAAVLPVKYEALGADLRSNNTETQLPRGVVWPQREALQNSNTLIVIINVL